MPTLIAPALPVSVEQRAQLTRMARSTVLPDRKVSQARELLLAADGVAKEEIARRCAVDSDTVRRWRGRFGQTGPDGVGTIARGRGRKPSLPAGTVAEVLRSQPDRHPVAAPLSTLTEREIEVLAAVAGGLSNVEIPERLVVTYATAKTHVSHLLAKLGARDRAQLVMIAYASGLVTPGENVPGN